MNVHWTDRAKARLRLLEEHIAQSSPQIARETVHRIISRSAQIGELPHSGCRVPEYDAPEVREMLERPYRIIDRARENQIDVLTVLHYRHLLPGDLS